MTALWSGSFDIPATEIKLKGRLQPGRMFLVDTEEGRIVDDEELKSKFASEHPYQEWLGQNLIDLEQLPPPPFVHQLNHSTVLLRQQAFGYTQEDLKLLLTPMGLQANEALGSMGTDTPLAVLSQQSQLLYNYFKQLFAQVTNPPVDALREELIMSTATTIGPEANMLEPAPECARQIKLSSPIITNDELEKLRLLGDSAGPWGQHGFKSITMSMLYDVAEGGRGLTAAIDSLCHQSSAAIADGYDIIILSDRELGPLRAPIPALLAVSAVHHHLIREGTRTQVGFVIESGEPREVHHFALLLGYGAAAINPYLAFETLSDMINQGLLAEVDQAQAIRNYLKAIVKGIVKVISKMGISTIQSYCGAQIFEAVGIDQDVIDKYFTWTPSRVGGIGLDAIAEESRERHDRAFSERRVSTSTLETGGQYQYRHDGEHHLFNPETIHKLQQACRTNSYEAFKKYSSLVDDQARQFCTLRGLMELQSTREPVPLDEVEPWESIVRRFKTGAMSYGSISQEAHETLAIAMESFGRPQQHRRGR
jgi:glutamate synthase (ferredoxin)